MAFCRLFPQVVKVQGRFGYYVSYVDFDEDKKRKKAPLPRCEMGGVYI